MRPESALASRGCHRPRVRSPQHGRPIGASIRGSPSSGRGSSGRVARGGHGGGDAAGAGGEAVPMPGGGRRGAAGAPGGRPQPAGLASGGHPSGVTPGLPQSGPGGKSAPLIPRVCACTPTFSQPYLGVPLAPASAGQLAVTPPRRAQGGFAHVPSRGRRLPACGFPMGAVTELDSLVSAGAPARLLGPGPGGSAAASSAAPGRPRRPFGEAGLRRQVGGGGGPCGRRGQTSQHLFSLQSQQCGGWGCETYPRGR